MAKVRILWSVHIRIRFEVNNDPFGKKGFFVWVIWGEFRDEIRNSPHDQHFGCPFPIISGVRKHFLPFPNVWCCPLLNWWPLNWEEHKQIPFPWFEINSNEMNPIQLRTPSPERTLMHIWRVVNIRRKGLKQPIVESPPYLSPYLSILCVKTRSASTKRCVKCKILFAKILYSP